MKFFDRFKKKAQIPDLIKIRPVGAECYADGWTDRRTDMTKLIVAFRNFANAPRSGLILISSTPKPVSVPSHKNGE